MHGQATPISGVDPGAVEEPASHAVLLDTQRHAMPRTPVSGRWPTRPTCRPVMQGCRRSAPGWARATRRSAHDPQSSCRRHGLHPPEDIQLAVDVAQMNAYGAVGHAQLLGHRAIGAALGQQLKNVDLLARQRLEQQRSSRCRVGVRVRGRRANGSARSVDVFSEDGVTLRRAAGVQDRLGCSRTARHHRSLRPGILSGCSKPVFRRRPRSQGLIATDDRPIAIARLQEHHCR